MLPAFSLEGKSTTHQLLLGLNFIFVLIVIISIAMFLTQGDSMRDTAFLDGKRIKFDAHTGKVLEGVNETSLLAEKEEEEDPLDNFEVASEEEEQMAHEKASLMTQKTENPYDKIPVFTRTELSLAEAPHPELTELSEWGDLPKTGAIGSPMSYYARPFDKANNSKPIIALAIKGVGASKAITERLMTFPKNVSFIYNPYGKHTAKWARNARNLGYEAWIEAPIQPADYPASDPGPLSLLLDLPPEDSIARLQQIYTVFPGFVGLTMEQSPYMESVSHLDSVAKDLRARGLALALPYETPTKNMKSMISRHPAYVTHANIMIDKNPDRASIETQLSKLLLQAKRKGMAVGMANAYPVTVDMLEAWLPTLKKENVVLAPLTAVYK